MEAPIRRTAFLVRTHNPTPAQLQRMQSWMAQLAGTEFQFFVSVDITSLQGRITAMRLNQLFPPGVVHCYSEASLLARYSAGIRYFVDPYLWPGGPTQAEVYLNRRKQGVSVAWALHAEPICLWAHSTAGFAFDFVWVSEDDVGFSGDLPCFLRAYAADDADLVTNTASKSTSYKPAVVKRGVVVRQAEGWFWHDAVSPAYAAAVPSHARYKTNEHLQRFSKKLLLTLDHLSGNMGITGWSEGSVVSLVLQRERGLTLRLFRPEHIGHTYSWAGRIMAREWTKICRADRLAEGEATMHPVGAAYTSAPPQVQPVMSKRRRLLVALPTGIFASSLFLPLGPPEGNVPSRPGVVGSVYHALKH